MEPDIYWSLIRSQLVELVKQIDQDAAKEGPQKTDKLMHLRQIVSRITTASASDSMELDKRGALSNVSRNSEHYRIKMHLADDVLTSISILCIAAEDPERSAQGRKFLRAVMIHNTVEKWTWITATKLLLDVRKVLADNGGGPAGFLREECGSLFDFFFGSSVDGDDADVNSEESKFFIDSTARLLGITLECLHECPNDDEASMTALFSSNLNVSSDESASSGTTTDNDQFDKHPLTLAQFLNNTLDSKYKCVRELTYEIIGLAAAKAPGHFAEPAASVFSRASAKDPDHALRAATAALGWESVQKGGASALAASLPDLGDSLFLDGHLKSTGWLRSIAVAVSSLSWSSSPLEDRQEVALSLMKTQLHIQASGSRAGRIFDRLVATASTEAVADALIGAAERGTKQILADAQFDLENILCGTGTIVFGSHTYINKSILSRCSPFLLLRCSLDT